jgi:hypothetical protein
LHEREQMRDTTYMIDFIGFGAAAIVAFGVIFGVA